MVYYNPIWDLIGLRIKNEYGDFLIFDHFAYSQIGQFDAIYFSSRGPEWTRIGEL